MTTITTARRWPRTFPGFTGPQIWLEESADVLVRFRARLTERGNDLRALSAEAEARGGSGWANQEAAEYFALNVWALACRTDDRDTVPGPVRFNPAISSVRLDQWEDEENLGVSVTLPLPDDGVGGRYDGPLAGAEHLTVSFTIDPASLPFPDPHTPDGAVDLDAAHAVLTRITGAANAAIATAMTALARHDRPEEQA